MPFAVAAYMHIYEWPTDNGSKLSSPQPLLFTQKGRKTTGQNYLRPAESAAIIHTKRPTDYWSNYLRLSRYYSHKKADRQRVKTIFASAAIIYTKRPTDYWSNYLRLSCQRALRRPEALLGESTQVSMHLGACTGIFIHVSIFAHM